MTDTIPGQGFKQSGNSQVLRNWLIGKNQLFVNDFQGDIAVDVEQLVQLIQRLFVQAQNLAVFRVVKCGIGSGGCQ